MQRSTDFGTSCVRPLHVHAMRCDCRSRTPQLLLVIDCARIIDCIGIDPVQVAMGIPLHKIPDIRSFYGKTDRYGDDAIDFMADDYAPIRNHVIAARITAENPDEVSIHESISRAGSSDASVAYADLRVRCLCRCQRLRRLLGQAWRRLHGRGSGSIEGMSNSMSTALPRRSSRTKTRRLVDVVACAERWACAKQMRR